MTWRVTTVEWTSVVGFPAAAFLRWSFTSVFDLGDMMCFPGRPSPAPSSEFNPGELILDRYLVRGNLGKGVFSTVLKAIDLERGNEIVAIKVIRNNSVM